MRVDPEYGVGAVRVAGERRNPQRIVRSLLRDDRVDPAALLGIRQQMVVLARCERVVESELAGVRPTDHEAPLGELELTNPQTQRELHGSPALTLPWREARVPRSAPDLQDAGRRSS